MAQPPYNAGIWFMIDNRMKSSHGHRDVFESTDNAADGSMYTKNQNAKIHSHDMPNPSKATGKATAS
jgi:hypothetical protein